MHKLDMKKGFTLVELSFSIAFLAGISLTLVLTITNLAAVYQRGITLKQVNTVGTEVINELRTSISNSSNDNIVDLCIQNYEGDANQTRTRQNCQKDDAYNFVNVARHSNVNIINHTSMEDLAVYGAFCSGIYSYIWNSGYFFNPEEYTVTTTPATLTYYDNDGNKQKKQNFKLLKVIDPSRAVCISASNAIDKTSYFTADQLSQSINGDFAIEKEYGLVTEPPVDLLETSANGALALYNLSIYRPVQDSASRNLFYSGSFILATITGGMNIMVNDSNCAPPNEYKAQNFNYCAINKFNFAAKANGE